MSLDSVVQIGAFGMLQTSDIDSIIQIRIEWADDVATAIENEDLNTMLEIFEIHRSGGKGFQEKMLDSLMNQYSGRIEVTDKGFIIDKRFMVDRNGTAHINQNYDGISGDKKKQKKIADNWKFICIVAAQARKRKLRLPDGTETEIDPTYETKLRNILFLLRPNINDLVFTDKLTDTILEELEYDNDEYEHKQRKKRSSPGVQ